MRNGILNALLLLCVVGGCKSPLIQPENSITTGHDLLVAPAQYDQFSRREVFQGPASLSLTLQGITLRAEIPVGDTSCTFQAVPDEPYILRVQKDGYAPFEAANYSDVSLYQIPPLSSKINAIECTASTGSYTATIATQDTVPAGGAREAVVFIGLTPSVGPTVGTYFADGTIWMGGGSNTASVTIWPNPSIAVPSGSKIYVTARLLSWASRATTDTSHHVNVYTNFDQNPPLVITVRTP